MSVSLTTWRFAAAGSARLGSERRSHLPVPRSPHVPMRPVPAPGCAGSRAVPGPHRRPPRRRPPTGRGRCRTSTSPARTASAPRATRRSKVWFTVADGVLSDVYFPTNDNTNNETLQYVVTDGSTFTDLQTRDMTYTVRRSTTRALTCRVIAKAKSGKYRIVTDFLTDPGRPTVIMRSRFEALDGPRADYRLYVRFDPTLNGNGGGGTGNGGADNGAVAPRPAANVLVGSDTVTDDQRRQPRLRACPCTRRSTPAAASPRSPTASRAPPATASSNSTRATRSPTLRQRDPRQPRADRTRRARPRRRVHARARLRRHPGRARSRAARRSLAHGFHAARRDYERSWHAYDARPGQAAAPARRLGRAHWDELARRVLPERELRQGGRGQDVPRRRRRRARLPVGPGGLGRRPRQHLLRLLPRGLRPRPLRGVDRRFLAGRPPDGDAT